MDGGTSTNTTGNSPSTWITNSLVNFSGGPFLVVSYLNGFLTLENVIRGYVNEILGLSPSIYLARCKKQRHHGFNKRVLNFGKCTNKKFK